MPKSDLVAGDSELLAASRIPQINLPSQMASPGATAVPAPTFLDNSSIWHNFTSWTAQHLRYSVNNVTRFAPSLEDLILAGPRMLTKLGIISFPDAVDGFGQRVIADPTTSDFFFPTTTAAHMLTQASEAAANVAEVLDNEDQDPAVLVSKFSADGTKGLGSVFSYATSKWALCCIAMVCFPPILTLKRFLTSSTVAGYHIEPYTHICSFAKKVVFDMARTTLSPLPTYHSLRIPSSATPTVHPVPNLARFRRDALG